MADKPKCSSKSYNCGKICLSVKRTCRIQPQGQQEQELEVLGDVIGSKGKEQSRASEQQPSNAPAKAQPKEPPKPRLTGGYLGDELLDIVSIKTDKKLEDFDFDKEQVEELANSIIEMQGLVNPLVVRLTGYNNDGEEEYELVDGYFQYFALNKAMELYPKLEMARAFVIKNALEEEVYQKQLALLRGFKPDYNSKKRNYPKYATYN